MLLDTCLTFISIILQASESCRTSCNLDFFKILDSAPTKYQVKLLSLKGIINFYSLRGIYVHHFLLKRALEEKLFWVILQSFSVKFL